MIAIRNIYYMLSYAFQVLNAQGYKSIETEDFNNTAELCTEILTQGISTQIKRGLEKEYVAKTDTLSDLRGKMDISASVKNLAIMKNRMVCTYDDFSENCYLNRIIKSTALLLLRNSDVSKKRKCALKNLMMYFANVDEIDINHIDWNQNYNRNNQNYRMLITVCYMVVKGLLQTQSDGTTRMVDFLDDQRMSHLYEKFILEYYRKEHPELTVSAARIPWALDDDENTLLPVMQSDIMLENKSDNKVLIIDAKYYSHSLAKNRFNTQTLHSANLYQIFTYVKNKEKSMNPEKHEVSGMLLYAKTDEDLQPDNCYHMSGNKISVRTLDLNQDFSQITKQLESIVEEHFL